MTEPDTSARDAERRMSAVRETARRETLRLARDTVLAALGELRAALPDAAARPETANETKTETRRPAEG